MGNIIIEALSIASLNLFSITLILMTCILVLNLWRKRPNNCPPGTNGLPLLGVVLSLNKFPERALADWAKVYGPLYMVKFGLNNVVVINSPEIAYEAFAKNDCFNDRPQTIPALIGKGIILADSSSSQKEQRRFGLNTLREFGMGRRSMESRLIEETNKFCDAINKKCGISGTSQPFEINNITYALISRIVSDIAFGRDIIKENSKFRDLLEEITVPSKAQAVLGILLFAPTLRFLPVFSTFWKSSLTYRDKMFREIKKELINHQRSLDSNNPRDFFDQFLIEIEKSKKIQGKGKKISTFTQELNDRPTTSYENPDSSFDEEQLIATGRDLFLAGTDTTASTILWIIHYLCIHSDVQAKLQSEIDNQLGQSGEPSMSKMNKLPYVRAVIQEVSRLRPVVPLSVPHQASRDAVLRGYLIPKGAIILTNIWAIHHDEARWPEPEKFIPERHLDENGDFIKSSDCMIFNVGARSCLGQQLAKMELFLLTITLFRRFKFSFPPKAKPDLDGESVATLRPLNFNVVATRR